MEHFITKIKIDKVKRLKSITINLDADKRKHLILTGENWSGKMLVLERSLNRGRICNDKG